MGTRGLRWVAASLVALWFGGGDAALGQQAASAADPLAKLSIQKGELAWDDVALGMSLVHAERVIGVTLAIDHGTGESPCATWTATADREGLQLTLGFETPKPGAKLAWLRVRFEGDQILASGRQLADALKGHFPDATWVQPKETPSLEDDLRPVFSVPGTKEPELVQFAPRESMVLARNGCIR